jgi:Na+/H+ antiporter NhaD/arsenite permease-like protein
MLSSKLLVIGVFCLVYLFLAASHRFKGVAVWAGAGILLALRLISPGTALTSINWNVMGIFWGALIVAELFVHSKVPAYLAEWLVNRSASVGMAFLLVSALSGFISAFVENVATVLIVAPVALAIAARIRVSPVPLLIGIAISSNLQGAATLIGDPPSMILAGYTGMTFNDFFFMNGRAGIFFAIELGALASLVVLYLVFRGHRQRLRIPRETVVESWVPTWLLVGMTFALAVGSGAAARVPNVGGIICMGFALVGLVWQTTKEKGRSLAILKAFDWETTFFLAGVFVLVGALVHHGIVIDIAEKIAELSHGSVSGTYWLLVWLSVGISAFVDNVPYVTAMIPVGQTIAGGLGISPFLFLFGLLIGASIGGNITPIGASANIVAVGMLRKRGHHTGFFEFVRIGLPFSLIAVAVAALFVWGVWR